MLCGWEFFRLNFLPVSVTMSSDLQRRARAEHVALDSVFQLVLKMWLSQHCPLPCGQPVHIHINGELSHHLLFAFSLMRVIMFMYSLVLALQVQFSWKCCTCNCFSQWHHNRRTCGEMLLGQRDTRHDQPDSTGKSPLLLLLVPLKSIPKITMQIFPQGGFPIPFLCCFIYSLVIIVGRWVEISYNTCHSEELVRVPMWSKMISMYLIRHEFAKRFCLGYMLTLDPH